MDKRSISENRYRQMQSELEYLRGVEILTSEQCENALNAYETKSAYNIRSKNLFLWTLTSLGVLMIGFSLFLFLSFNWKFLAPCWKLTIVMSSLFLIYLSALFFQKRRMELLTELFYFGGAILYGVNIWQIAQIFNMTLGYTQGVWSWGIGVFLLALLMRSSLLHLLASAIFIVWTTMVVFRGNQSELPLFLTENGIGIHQAAWSLPIIAFIGMAWGRRRGILLASTFYLLAFVWWCYLQPIVWELNGFTVYYLVGLSGLFSFVGMNRNKERPYLILLSIFGFPILMAGCLSLGQFCANPQLPFHVETVFIFILLWICYGWIGIKQYKEKREKKKLFRTDGMPFFIGLIATLTGLLLTIDGESKGWFLVLLPILYNLLALAFSLYLMQSGRKGFHAFFEFGVFYFILWAIVRYCDLFGKNGGMIGAAIVFLVLGLVLFISAWYWYRYGREESLKETRQPTAPVFAVPEENARSFHLPILVILLQFVLLLQMIAQQTLPFLLSETKTIIVETALLDPRSLFRGDYITLNYSFSSLDGGVWDPETRMRQQIFEGIVETKDQNSRGNREIIEHRQVYTEMQPDPKNSGRYIPVRISFQKPKQGIFLQGRIRKNHFFHTVRYGIEHYYVQEGTGRKIEKTIKTEPSRVLVHLRVTPTGQAQIQRVEVMRTEKKAASEQYEAFHDILLLVDWHIHLRGGMTAQKAIARTNQTGLRSGVLENYGREWPLSDNEKLRKFIDSVREANLLAKPPLYVGIQVNDRDWFTQIDPKLYRRLDYILADTMIMGEDSQGKPQRLWLLPEDYHTDKDKWFARYLEHNLKILDEPIDILANPTYLPKFIAADYDRYWTDENMQKLIDKAVNKGIALEIQAESEFPKERFIKLAKKAGARFSFGSNNKDSRMKKLDTWRRAIKDQALTQKDVFSIEK